MIGGKIKVQTKSIYMTSEILVNSDGRILHADKAFCEIFGCKNSDAIHNSSVLDFMVEEFRHTAVNAFIDTFYGKQEGKLYEVKMYNSTGTPLDVTINFFLSKASLGEKATLLIRKKIL